MARWRRLALRLFLYMYASMMQGVAGTIFSFFRAIREAGVAAPSVTRAAAEADRRVSRAEGRLAKAKAKQEQAKEKAAKSAKSAGGGPGKGARWVMNEKSSSSSSSSVARQGTDPKEKKDATTKKGQGQNEASAGSTSSSSPGAQGSENTSSSSAGDVITGLGAGQARVVATGYQLPTTAGTLEASVIDSGATTNLISQNQLMSYLMNYMQAQQAQQNPGAVVNLNSPEMLAQFGMYMQQAEQAQQGAVIGTGTGGTYPLMGVGDVQSAFLQGAETNTEGAPIYHMAQQQQQALMACPNCGGQTTVFGGTRMCGLCGWNLIATMEDEDDDLSS